VGRAAVVCACLFLAFSVVACGGGHASTGAGEKEADAAVIDGALEGELTAVDAYTRALGSLRGQALLLARRLRGQDQEHVDALTKAMRGLGAAVEAEAAELEGGGGDRTAALDLAYEQESAALAYDIGAESRLYTTGPRTLAAALAASHAQHLVLLRQALGVPLTAAAPEALESGDVPPPREPAEAR
jgi:hypothetical protein